tara:strand:- start:1423 stop:3525 length:2103 start_codon:yes stop_codon:yes gene_type:complete
MKDNFKKQVGEEYEGCFAKQEREEMPTLDPNDRVNFKEVELGYDSEEIAKHEAARCLECGCTEVFTCDLKRFATDYDVDQNKHSGEYKEYEIDFRHPFVEIDNNKCILCARCVRICREVVGANALGLVNRGYNTYVAPAMGDKLQDSNCESCGLCISTCPTGAITENVLFKPGPVKLEDTSTICNYCSVGCDISLQHHGQFVMRVDGNEGQVNKDGNLCKYAKFGYQYLNDVRRITTPLLKKGDKYEEISFAEAYKVIEEKIKAVKPEENAFFAGARLTNEEQYLIQKFARGAVKTNNIASFHYLGRGIGYANNAAANVPFEEIKDASKIFMIGSEINEDNAVAGFMINNAQFKYNVPVSVITDKEESSLEHKADEIIKVKSYFHFIKAVNYYLVANNFQNAMFLNDNCTDYETYKEALQKENFVELIEKSGVPIMDHIIEFVKAFNNEMNAVIVFSEKELSPEVCTELFNLAMITGKLGKTASGLISLKEKNNSQGIFDMGIAPKIGVGTQCLQNDDFIAKMNEKWGTDYQKAEPQCIVDGLNRGFKNMFIFGEDPVGCAVDTKEVKAWMKGFVVVQDYFMTETAKEADLILPASMPIETGGSFTNTQKTFQEFEAEFTSKVDELNYQQLNALLKAFGVETKEDLIDIRMEALSLLPTNGADEKFAFKSTEDKASKRRFNYGCDHVNLRFEEQFSESMK